MHIYQAEQDAGLTELLSAKSSIVYASLAEKSDITEPAKKKLKENVAFASLDDSDLYYTQSILVTTSWNKNDDIFDMREVWLAKDTPNHKPTNLEHNENIIVGHITSNWPIDDDGNLIPENTDLNNLPEKFHILTGSVIYRGFTEPELRSRSAQLISEIESGAKYVSMECFFKGFDYGLINKSTGQYKILPRNEETAFLTKHLRAYGGLGEHENYKIGRVLKDITFSGKGFVDKPANPESIIFTKQFLITKETASVEKNEEKKDNSEIEGVFSNQANLKETNMSIETEVVEPTVETETVATTETVVEEVLAPTPTESTEPAEAAAPMMNEKKEDEEDEEDEEDDDTEEKEEAKEKEKEAEEEVKKMKAALEETLAQLNSVNETLAAYKKKEEEMAKKAKKEKRMATLIQNGVNQELATSSVDQFDSLDDTTFDSIASLLSAVRVASVANISKEEAPVLEDVSAALENVETESNVDLSVSSETESEIQNTRAALVDFVCIRLGKKLNKGE